MAQGQLETLLKDNSRKDSNKIVVFLSDGKPTYASYEKRVISDKNIGIDMGMEMMKTIATL